MWIKYHDEIGCLIEEVDEYGISCDGEKMFFNDKEVEAKYVDLIQEGTI